MTIATIRRVPVDLIIHSLAERFDPSKNEGAEGFTDNALSLGLYACIDSNGLAEEWAVSGGVAQTAEWMATVITDCDSWREPTAAETRVAEVAVCKRLLVTACNLCVTQDAEDHTAATALAQAASRILGVDVSRIIRTSADVEGYKDAMALQAAREQLQAALGRTPDAPPLTLRVLIACLASKHTAAVADATAKDGFRAEMHAAIGREMAMRKQVAAMQDQFVKVRDIFDKALGTTKGATTFTLEDIAEEMALQRARFKQERDAANDGNRFVRGVMKACADEAAKHTGEGVTIYAAEQAGVIGAALRKLVADRDAAEEARRLATIRATDAENAADMARKGRLTTIRQLDNQYARMCEILGARGDSETAEDAANRLIAERDEAIKDLAVAEEARRMVIAERDSMRATIENLRRIIREADGEEAPVPVKTKPQPGDAVPWAEVEDGALYFSGDSHGAKFLAFAGGLWFWLYDAEDGDLVRLLRGAGCSGTMIRPSERGTTLVARDLGTDPEAWRKAMREWTANGNRPAKPLARA